MKEKRQRKKNVTFIILGTKNLGETDKVIFLYTNEYGLLHVIAKNSRKLTSQFTGKLIPLSHGTAEIYFGPKRIILTEVKSKNLIGLTNNLKTLRYAQEIANIAKRITPENQTHPHLIKLLIKTITYLKATEKKDIIFATFIIKLFESAGLIPDFKSINTSTEKKYLKFFNYIKTENLEVINNIVLTKIEEKFIKSKIESLIENVLH